MSIIPPSGQGEIVDITWPARGRPVSGQAVDADALRALADAMAAAPHRARQPGLPLGGEQPEQDAVLVRAAAAELEDLRQWLAAMRTTLRQVLKAAGGDQTAMEIG
jgi:hypothetical protein